MEPFRSVPRVTIAVDSFLRRNIPIKLNMFDRMEPYSPSMWIGLRFNDDTFDETRVFALQFHHRRLCCDRFGQQIQIRSIQRGNVNGLNVAAMPFQFDAHF